MDTFFFSLHGATCNRIEFLHACGNNVSFQSGTVGIRIHYVRKKFCITQGWYFLLCMVTVHSSSQKRKNILSLLVPTVYYKHTHTHARARVRAHTRTHARTHTHAHTQTRARARAHTHAHTNTHAHTEFVLARAKPSMIFISLQKIRHTFRNHPLCSRKLQLKEIFL